MIIKRFEAATAAKAFELVKNALGEDAVILSNKTLDKGTDHQRTEIMAAMDYDVENVTEPLVDQEAGPAKTNAPPAATYNYAAVRKVAKKKQPTSAPRPRLESQELRKNFNRILQEKGGAPQNTGAGATKPSSAAAAKPNQRQIKEWRDKLIGKIKAAPIRFHNQDGPTIIALVGPTGVGKTTSAAKIAAWYHLREGKKVTLLSMDCYRIGATDQLRTYARIMRLPCEVAIRKKDLAQAVARHQNCDLIIIDTAGKSPYDTGHVDELHNWFSNVTDLHPLLVLSATTKKEDLEQIVKSYDQLEPHSLILTKLDETRTYATLCQQVANAQLPVGYLTMGQRVPEDFLVADKPFLESFFKKGWGAVEQKIN